MYLGTMVRHLEMILARLLSLQSLQFCASGSVECPKHVAVPAIASMLFNAALPFRLTHFECSMSMLRHMAPFLRKQDTIERLATVTHWCDDELALSRALAQVQHLSVPALPHLKHCKGSPLFVQTIARGRDLRSAIFVRNRSVQGRWILPNSYQSAPLTRVDSLGITEPRAVPELLPHLISSEYGVSITSIKHLALRTCHISSFQPAMLRDFPQLRSFEYTEELLSSWRHNTFLDPNFITQFERNSPTLRRLTMMDYLRTIEFTRKDSLDPIVIDETWETAMWGGVGEMLPIHCDIQVPEGSCWRVRTSVNRLADMII